MNRQHKQVVNPSGTEPDRDQTGTELVQGERERIANTDDRERTIRNAASLITRLVEGQFG